MAIEDDVRLARAGDAEARARLLELAGRLAYARARELVSDRALAEDVTQETLLVVLESLPRLREPKAFLGWLRTIVDRVSARLRNRSGNDARFEAEPRDDGEGPAQAVEREEAFGQVRRAMAALPPRDRLMVKLFYYEGLSCRQVAEFLDTTADAVKAQLKRTRHKLKERMMTTPAKKSERLSITWRFSSDGPDEWPRPFPEGYFPDELTHLAYFNLYPGGTAEHAVGRRGVPRERLESIIESLHALGLIEPTDGEWRCTVPVVTDEDMEALKPWATPVASVVTSRLDELYDDILRLSELAEGRRPVDTIKVVALGCEVRRRAFIAPTRAMNVAASTRQGQVAAFVAASTSYRLHAGTFLGGSYTSEWEAKDARAPAYEAYCEPKGTDRTSVRELASRCGGSLGDKHHVLWRLFERLFAEPVPVGREEELLTDVGIGAEEARDIWQRLIDLGALEQRDGVFVLLVPHLPLSPWKEFLSKLDRIGDEVADVVSEGADALRQRILHCSFADCNFSDSVFASFWCAEGLIVEEIKARGGLETPESADFSWGVLLAG